ncbi:MAG: hypothetical protein ABH834_06900 [Candidatus Altiarchaeota archaeon]
MTYSRQKILRLVNLLVLFYLLVLGVQLFRRGIVSVEPESLHMLDLDRSVINSFGKGWAAAMMILSGSPVAAISVGLHSSSVINAYSAVSAILGSRVGATAVVFLLGGMYYLKGKRLKRSLGSPTIIFLITFIMSAVALVLALISVKAGVIGAETQLIDGILPDVNEPAGSSLADRLCTLLGGTGTLMAGVVLIVLVVELLEKVLVLPEDRKMLESTGVVDKFIKNPYMSFMTGLFLTAIFFTIAVSFSLLVPLYASKRIRREHMIPYIIGGNIGTFSDTVLVALVTGSAKTTAVVSVCVVANIIVAAILLSRKNFSGEVIAISDYILARRKRTLFFVIALITTPLAITLL